MSNVIVHKAAEPSKLTKAGKARFKELVDTRAGIIMRKMDGVYCQIKLVEGKWMAFSRTGEHLTSVDEAILLAFRAKGDPRRTYVGELWLKGQTHAEINGRARRKAPQYLQFWITDSFIPGVDERFIDRLWRADMVATPNAPVNISFRREHRKLRALDLDDLYAVAKGMSKSTVAAYDGLIYRDPDAFFIEGDGKGGEIVKIKPRNSGDFRVVGVVEGDDTILKDAFSWIPQSTVGCITGLADSALQERIDSGELTNLAVWQNNHDSLLVECPADQYKEVARVVCDAMNIKMKNHRGEEFAMRSEASVGEDWYHMEEIKL